MENVLPELRCSDDPRATEGIDDIHPALAELPFVIITHGDVHTILVLNLLVVLQETLVLQVEAVFEQSVLQILRDVVQRHMTEHRAHDRHEEVEPRAARKREETRLPATVEHPHREEHQHQAKGQRIDDHALGVELKMFLVPRADAGYADDEQRHDFTVKQMTVLVDVHQLHPAVNVRDDATPERQHSRGDGILKKLDDK